MNVTAIDRLAHAARDGMLAAFTESEREAIAERGLAILLALSSPVNAALKAAIDAKLKHRDNSIDSRPDENLRARVLGEEYGEVCEAIQQIEDAHAALAASHMDAENRRDLIGDLQHARRALQKELAQVAACALLWLAAMQSDPVTIQGWRL